MKILNCYSKNECSLINTRVDNELNENQNIQSNNNKSQESQRSIVKEVTKHQMPIIVDFQSKNI